MFLTANDPHEFAFVAVDRQIGFHRLYYANVLLSVGVVFKRPIQLTLQEFECTPAILEVL